MPKCTALLKCPRTKHAQNLKDAIFGSGKTSTHKLERLAR